MEGKTGLRRSVVIVVILYLVILMSIFSTLKYNSENILKNNFNFDAKARADLIINVIERRLFDVDIIRSFFQGSTSVEPEEFDLFTKEIIKRAGTVCIFQLHQSKEKEIIVDAAAGLQKELLKNRIFESDFFSETISLITNNQLVISPINGFGEIIAVGKTKSQNGKEL